MNDGRRSPLERAQPGATPAGSFVVPQTARYRARKERKRVTAMQRSAREAEPRSNVDLVHAIAWPD